MAAAAIDQQMPSDQKGFFIFKEIKNAESWVGQTKMEKAPKKKIHLCSQ